MAVKTYSPKDITVIVAGTIITGFAEDTFVTLERDSEAFVKIVGADGEVARSASADLSGTIVLIVMIYSLHFHQQINSLCLVNSRFLLKMN
mgnify:CR=1 FL=1